MRPAGKASSIGDVPPEDRARVLRTSSWKVVYDESHAPRQRSETRAELFSTMRDSACRMAAIEVLAAPSLSSRGAALRKSHIDIGFERPGDVQFRRHTETKQSYCEQPLPILQSAEANKQKLQSLQKSNIDLAFGVPKTCKGWHTDMSEKMAANVDAKYACARNDPIDGSRNYRSEVNFGDSPPGVADVHVSESKCQYGDPGKPTVAVSFAATRGRELQQHSWDNAMGRLKTTTHWMPAQSAEMAWKAPEKFDVSKPVIDPRLQKELRQSSIYLGKDAVAWPAQGIQRSLSMPGLAPASLGKGICRL